MYDRRPLIVSLFHQCLAVRLIIIIISSGSISVSISISIFKLGIHLKTHNGVKSNTCNQCDCACSQASKLRAHLKLHTEKQNKCIHSDSLFYHCLAVRPTASASASASLSASALALASAPVRQVAALFSFLHSLTLKASQQRLCIATTSSMQLRANTKGNNHHMTEPTRVHRRPCLHYRYSMLRKVTIGL